MESHLLTILYLVSSLLCFSNAKSVTTCQELVLVLQENVVEQDISIEGNIFCDRSENWTSSLTIQSNVTITGDNSGVSTLTLPKNATIATTRNNTLQIRDMILFIPSIEDALGLRFLEVNNGSRVFVQNVIVASDLCLGSTTMEKQRILEMSNGIQWSSSGECLVHMCRVFYACHNNGRLPDFVTDSFGTDDCCSHCFKEVSNGMSHSSTESSDGLRRRATIVACAILGLIFISSILVLVLLMRRSKSTGPLQYTETTMDENNDLLRLNSVVDKKVYTDKDRINSRECKFASSENPDLQTRALTDRNFNLSDVEIKEPLGKGSFGKVYKGHWQGTDVAVKCIVHGRDFLEPGNEPFEAYLSRHVSHPNVVQTFIIHTVPRGGNRAVSVNESISGSSFSEMAPTEAYNRNIMISTDDVFGSITKGSGVQDQDSLETWIVLEFCDRGSLSNAVHDGSFKIPIDRGTKPNVANALLTALDIANAMMYLHNIRIVHGDLKTENVLLKNDVADPRGFVCKVSDFGLSRFLAEDTHIETFTYGTITHMPPELLKGGILTPAADVYSFAVLMWELLTGVRPFEGKTHGEIVLLVVNREKRPQIPDYCPEGYAELLEDCWRQSHLERPGFPEVVDRLKELLIEEREHMDSEKGSGIGSTKSMDVSANPGDYEDDFKDDYINSDNESVPDESNNVAPSPGFFRKSY